MGDSNPKVHIIMACSMVSHESGTKVDNIDKYNGYVVYMFEDIRAGRLHDVVTRMTVHRIDPRAKSATGGMLVNFARDLLAS
ncbi:unnamed protein product [Sphagnum balticum]